MFSYLKFLAKSTNHHGVHSPFVFDYLVNCLYVKPKLSKNQFENVILKSIPYFNVKSIRIENYSLQPKIGAELNSFVNTTGPWDMVLFERCNLETLLQIIIGNQVHNDTLFLIQDIRSNRKEWKAALKHPKITVSIDAHHLGCLFIRKEQVKEHFTIRL